MELLTPLKPLRFLLVLACYGTAAAHENFVNDGIDTCSRPYQLIYKNDAAGNAVAGSKTALKNAVLRGANIRVVSTGINGGAEEDFLVSTVNNVNIRGSEVCASILDHVGQMNFEHRPTTSYYLQVYCTTGLFNFVNHLIDGTSIVNNGTGTATVYWFAWMPSSSCLDLPATPTYSHFTDGGTHTGLLASLAAAVTGGKPVKVVRRDVGYVTGMDLLQVEDGTNIVNGQSVWHTGLSYGPDHVLFNTDLPYRWLSSWTTTGRRHNQRWTYGGQEVVGHNVDYQALDWFVDPCWRRVYTHTVAGVRTQGTLDDLLSAIDQGHRIRVKVGPKVLEARALRVGADYVQAQLSDQIAHKGGVADDRFDLVDAAFWNWMFVDTNGAVYQEHYYHGNNSEAAPMALATATLDWFADTRPWSRLLEVNSTGAVTFGLKANLQNAIRSGANFRFMIHNTSDDQKLYLPADNAIYYKTTGEDSVAQSMRILDLDSSNKLVTPPRWSFYLASSKGSFEKAIYAYALENSFVSQEETPATVVFYADDYVPLV